MSRAEPGKDMIIVAEPSPLMLIFGLEKAIEAGVRQYPVDS